MPDTQTNYERTKELTDRLEAGMKDLFQSDKYKNFLITMSRFHHYSRRNIQLIDLQCPGATRVASYNNWKEQFNRQVKKGEEGIRIYAPVKDKGPEKKLMEKLDPVTGAPLLDENGKVIMEEMTALTSGVRFKLVPVFDVSQTHGEPLPELAENLTGNVEHYTAFMDALKDVSPLPIMFEPLKDNNDGYCRFGEKIGIREGMSEIQTVAAVIHELTHARLHDIGSEADKTAPKSKAVKETEAESCVYVVAQHFGIETSANSFGYLAEYGNRDLRELYASLDAIRKESNSLINAIDTRFKQICAERGIDLTVAAPETATAAVTQPEPEFTAETRTETITGVDFEVTEIKPLSSAQTQEPAQSSFSPEEIREMDIYQFAADYIDNVAKIHGTTGRMGKAEREDAINGIAGIMQKGKLDGIREALDRAIGRNIRPEQSAALLERLETMFSQPAPPRPEPGETMPDPMIGISEMNLYGYRYEGMLPLMKEKALELYDNDQPIYLLYADNSEAMALDRSEIETFGGIFGIDRGEWERTREYAALSAQNSEAAKESGVINGDADMFGIYQLKDREELRYHRFASLEQLESENLAVDRSNYELVYTAPLPPKETLDELYARFNENHPKDYTGRSLSVSDVVVIQQDGDISSHYVDDFGFAELPAFLGNERQPESAAPELLPPEAKSLPQPVTGRELSDRMGLDLSNRPVQENKSSPPPPDIKNPSVYMKSPGYARDNDEVDQYRESLRLNKECAGTIDAAIRECAATDKPGYRLTNEAVDKVIDAYGEQRVSVVLANTVRLQEWDGRYSGDTKKWAKEVEMPEMKDSLSFYSAAHPAVIDGYIRLARKEMDRRNEKPSILEALKQGADKARKNEPPQKETPSKNKGLEV